MSVKALADTMSYSPYKLAARLVHFVVADIANDDHENLLWATPRSLAEKAGVSIDTVHRAMQQMVKDGYLELVMPADNARHHPATYHFVMPSTLNKSAPQFADRSPERSANAPMRSANTPLSAPQMPEPTAFTNASGSNGKEPGAPFELQAPPVATTPRRATPLPTQFFVSDDMRDWLHLNQLEHLDWRTETAQFCDHHRARGTSMKDWKAAWRTWMRNAGKWQAEHPLSGVAKQGYATPMSKKDQLLQQQMAVAAQAREAARANGRH